MSTNDTPGTDPSLLWETAKAFLRGSIISYTAALKRNAIKNQLQLECLIQELEKQFKVYISQDVLKKLEAARSALNQPLTSKAETSILLAKQRLNTVISLVASLPAWLMAEVIII